MNYHINQKVTTPIGDGVYQGDFTRAGADDAEALVRMPVNEQTGPHLKDSNCLTPRARFTALFSFKASEMGATALEYAIIFMVIALVVLVITKCSGQPI